MTHQDHYDSEGKLMPSVSQIPNLVHKNMDGFEDWICSKLHGKDISRCCTHAKRDFYKESGSLGKDVHALREAFLNGQPFSEEVPEYQAHLFDPIAQFYTDNKYLPLFNESQMVGKTVGGSWDGCGKFGIPFWESLPVTFWHKHPSKGRPEARPTVDDIWVDDLKVKSKLDELHPVQLYGYAKLAKEVHGIEPKWGLIIRREKKLDKRPELQLRAYYLEDYKEIWDALFYVWHFMND